MKRHYRKIIATGVIAGLMSSMVLSGCGKKDDPTQTTVLDPNGQSYVAEFIDITAANGQKASLSKMYMHEDKLYVAAYTDEDNRSSVFLSCINTADMLAESWMEVGNDLKQRVDTSELPSDIKDYESGISIEGVAFKEDGYKIYAEWFAYKYSDEDPDGYGYSEEDLEDVDLDEAETDYESYSKKYVVEYDSYLNLTGIEEVDYSFVPEGEYIQEIVEDEKGHIYFVTTHCVVVTDEENNVLQNIKITDNWVDTYFIDANGDMNIKYYDDKWESKMVKVTPNSPTPSESIDVDEMYANEYIASKNNANVIYYYDSEKLCSKDLSSGEVTELFRWLALDIDGSSLYNMCEGEDGVFYVSSYDYADYSSQIAKIYKKSNAEIDAKIEVRLAALENYDNTMESAIVAYNKSQSKYRIVADYYYDWADDNDDYEDSITDLNNAILSANAPDIICLDGLDTQALVNKGVLADISSYVANDSTVNLEDYNKKVVEAYTFDGKLVALPRSFNLMTLIVNSNDFPEDKAGWTLTEMLEYINAHPGAELEAYMTRDEFAEYYIGYNLNEYIDRNNGTCDFNKESFRKALEYAATLPEQYDFSNINYEINIGEALASGKVLSQRMYISETIDIQMIEAYFKIGAKYIGFPNAEGKNVQVMTTGTGYSIAANSANKEAAWEFLAFYLNRERTDWDYSFPSKNSELQAIYDKELEHAGEPNGSGMSDENGFQYEFHYSTQEEIDKINELIDNAVALSVDTEIMNIINEEAGAYYSGQKPLDDVIGLIQSRVQLYVSERM